MLPTTLGSAALGDDGGMPRATLVLAVLVGALTVAALPGCTTTTDPTEQGATTTTAGSSGGPTTAPDPDDPDADPPVADAVRILVLSSQPDRATGPDARIRVLPAGGGDPSNLRVSLGGQDVTGQLRSVDGGLEGVITGLVEGTNTVTATDGSLTATQRIRSWPTSGPMISGPHLPLLACDTEAAGLGPATDADCSAPTQTTWSYVTRSGTVADLPADAAPGSWPTDLATLDDGTPFVIRHEVGVRNRSIYEIAVVDPTGGRAETGARPDDISPDGTGPAAWNGTLVYRFGDGCGATYGQGRPNVAAVAPDLLAEGYAVATASFTSGAVLCNDVIAAETVMMVKERVIEELGEPRATIGQGAGFGAALLHLVVQDYPGLVDGAVALDPQVDIVTAATGAAECSLLEDYYASVRGSSLTAEQRMAIDGHASPSTCQRWQALGSDLADPSDGCDPSIAPDRIWSPANAAGVRCDLAGVNAVQFGVDPATGLVVRPFDNVGVQYGLEALNAGTISVEEFLDLNEHIGGLDADGRPQAARTAVDPLLVQTFYEQGRVSTGVGDQPKIPILEIDRWDDPTGAIGDHLRPFSFRDRLNLNGPVEVSPGLAIWTRPATTATGGTSPVVEGVQVVDEWLVTLAGDGGGSGGSRAERLADARPVEGVDGCTLPDGRSVVDVHANDEDQPCGEAYPVSGDPRIAAGGPRRADALKCQLKPIDLDDYEVDLADEQYTRLVTAFPDGVCDWTQAGAGQTIPSMSDRSYDDVEVPADLA